MCPDGRDGYYETQRGTRYLRPLSQETLLYQETLEPTEPPFWQRLVQLAVVLAALFWMFSASPAPAMNHGFDPDAPATKWFERLQQPDNQPGSCCGKADGYPVDRYWKNVDSNGTPTGTWTAVIADGSAKLFPDGTHREYIATGTEVEVPETKINDLMDDLDNPTEHGWIFMVVHAGEVGRIYCFVRHPTGG